MLKRLLTPLVPLPGQSTRPQAEKQEDAAATEAFAFLSVVAAAMPSLDPPPAANDSPIAAAHKVVEYELVHAGYLRCLRSFDFTDAKSIPRSNILRSDASHPRNG